MKKLIVFGLTVATACAVNAASFQWAAADVNGTSGSGNTLTSASDAATFVLVYLGNSGTPDWDNATAVQEGTWKITSSKGVDNAKVQGTYTGTGAEGLANGNIYGVMVRDDQGGLHKVAGTTTYTVTGYSGDTWAGDTFTFATSNYVADKASYPAGGGSGGVPEPTSGLLLLVGAGMLALRRKQK